ncbi:immunoglobulin-like domain-containing protein, partial [Bacillus cereus]
MKTKKENKRIDQLKPINIVASAAIIATTMFTPIVDVLPGQYNAIHAAQKAEDILTANASNDWQGAKFYPSDDAVVRGSDYLRWEAKLGEYNYLNPSSGAFMNYFFRGIEMKFRPLNTAGRLFFDRTHSEMSTQLGVFYDFTLKTWGVTNLGMGQQMSNPPQLDKVEFIDNSIIPEKDKWGIIRVVTSPTDHKTRVYYDGVLVLQTTNFGMEQKKQVIEFGITNGQILDVEYINVSESVFSVSNEKPSITGEEKTSLKQGSTFDPLSGMSATDKEDGDLTGKLKVTENTVDSKKPGSYKVKYEVTD